MTFQRRSAGSRCASRATTPGTRFAVVLDEAKVGEPKTGALASRLDKLGWSNVLIIAGAEIDDNFARAAANIPNIDVLPQQGVNVYDILRRDTLVLTKDAVKHLEERLA